MAASKLTDTQCTVLSCLRAWPVQEGHACCCLGCCPLLNKGLEAASPSCDQLTLLPASPRPQAGGRAQEPPSWVPSTAVPCATRRQGQCALATRPRALRLPSCRMTRFSGRPFKYTATSSPSGLAVPVLDTLLHPRLMGGRGTSCALTWAAPAGGRGGSRWNRAGLSTRLRARQRAEERGGGGGGKSADFSRRVMGSYPWRESPLSSGEEQAGAQFWPCS